MNANNGEGCSAQKSTENFMRLVHGTRRRLGNPTTLGKHSAINTH
ncbi:unnamed protein product [Ectocarpus sp. 6 AP-2014]